jgi:hypothetical protein
MTYNALGLSSLVVGECLKDTLPLARDCYAIEVTETNEALARSEGASPERSVNPKLIEVELSYLSKMNFNRKTKALILN